MIQCFDNLRTAIVGELDRIIKAQHFSGLYEGLETDTAATLASKCVPQLYFDQGTADT